VSYSNLYSISDEYSSKYYKKALYVNVDRLNLRYGPNTNYDIIKVLSKNQRLIFLAMTGNWVKVKDINSGRTGFIYYKYVFVTE
jgi:uncharacterized protein YgiM (DUF1202 family)